MEEKGCDLLAYGTGSGERGEHLFHSTESLRIIKEKKTSY